MNPLYNDRKQSWSQTATNPPFSAARINERDKEGYIYTSLQSSSADTFWAIANPLGWKQLLIITYRGKVSALGLKTVSILRKCVYRNKFRQDSNKCTQEFKKWIGSQRKMLQNMSTDDSQVGGGKPCSFSSTEQPTRKYRLDRKVENAPCLDSLCITEHNYLTTKPKA